MRSAFSLFLFSVLFAVGPARAVVENELFPFVISYDAPDNVTNISSKLDAPAGKDGFVRVEDGHFVTNKGRIRFWATTTCFEANFLDKEAADRFADRLARFGYNCVRLHFLDSRDNYRNEKAIWGGAVSKSRLELDPESLEKLDYQIAALKKRGIYVDLNLHVGRVLDERDGFPKVVNRPPHDKGIDNFYRPLIEANKKYAKDLLEHVNPYTGNAYKDEPCVAMIETNNENSIVAMWSGWWRGMDFIQDPFLSAFQKEWNDWLKAKYKNDDNIRNAWGCREEPLGKEMLRSGDLPEGFVADRDGWNFQTDPSTDATISNRDGVLCIDVKKTGEQFFIPQLQATGFGVEEGRLYTITIRTRANRESRITIGVGMNHAPWNNLGCNAPVDLTTEWQTFVLPFTASQDDDHAKLSVFSLNKDTVYEIDSISLKPGGQVSLPMEKSQLVEMARECSLERGTFPVIWKKDLGCYPVQVGNDFCDFVMDLEARYWDEMRGFLKDEIKVRQPISGTQLEFGSVHTQATMDYCDIHAYWNHPEFPGRPFDGHNWYIRNRALVNHLDRMILPILANKRVFGRPYVVDEYNHPFPNQYGGEGLPMIAAFGAFQGWDAIFPFTYSHYKNIQPGMAMRFFDMAGHTVQLAHMIACHCMFIDGLNEDVDKDIALAPLTREKEREIFKRERNTDFFDFRGLGLDPRHALLRPIGLDVSEKVSEMPSLPVIPKEQNVFSVRISALNYCYYNKEQKDQGYASLCNKGGAVFTGFVEEGKKYPFFNGTVRFGKTNLGWATVSLARADRKANRMLLVATGEMLNSDMKIEKLDGDKITVGNKWGKAPTLCEGIPASVELKTSCETLKCWALDESGFRKQEVDVTKKEDGFSLDLNPHYKTLWYEIEAVR